MGIKTYIFGAFQVNTYVITQGTKAVIIDPGMNSDILKTELQDYEVVGILITHAHIDHIDGIGNFNCPIYISKQDYPGLKDMRVSLYKEMNLRPSYDFNKLNVIKINDLDEINIGDFHFKALLTPGHTMGSVSYIYKDVCFTGDTLFRCSQGRCDFYGGNEFAMQKSLKRLCDTLNDETRIYPGHDDSSNMKFEKKYNPFIKEILKK